MLDMQNGAKMKKEDTKKDVTAQDEMQKGGKCLLLRRGFVVTDQVSGTPTVGQAAYLFEHGQITAEGAGDLTQVGRFLSTKDNDGYAKVAINIV